MNTKELSEVVHVLLQKEEDRQEGVRLEKIEREQQRRVDLESNIEQLAQSVDVIKWCIMSMTAVMFVTIIGGILIVMEIEREAERIKGQVQEIQREAEMIRDKIRHPLETLGGSLGRKIEGKIGEAIMGDQ
ncbi:MAG: hypothetical protein ACR2RV_06435 [Verrucomicrobiales bacterium]